MVTFANSFKLRLGTGLCANTVAPLCWKPSRSRFWQFWGDPLSRYEEDGLMDKRYSFLLPGEGANYKWSNDHSYVKVSAADTGGTYSLIEDNLTAEFTLGLHLHRHHAESFYIVEGSVPFYLDGDWLEAGPGTTIHVPPGIPHAVDRPGTNAKMIMVIQPSGFDQYLAELGRCSEADLANELVMNALAEKYDIISLGGVPAR